MYGVALISVALCTHNGASYIGEQIRSICLQTLPPSEIVLSDDASTDDTVNIATAAWRQALSERGGVDIELRVLRNSPALRVTKNFEQAAVACRFELIALSDQDDSWPPDRLERMAAEFDRRPDLLLLHTDARLVDKVLEDLGQSLFFALEVTPDELRRIHEGNAFDVFLRRNLVTGAATLFRKRLLESAVPFPDGWVHDEWLGIIAAAVGRVDVIEAPLLDYRQHGGNQIGASRDSFTAKVRKALASRGNTHAERARKAEQLLDRLGALSAPGLDAKREKVRGKLAHQRFRAALPAARLARIAPVLREAATGRYDLYGRGFRGVVRDLFESV
ncbi:MAG: glycosyltransferase family 2 protein [Proteobacteria bacterium]|nr:glycosyltransferase family 2 protein [Pseudomonadota bacterium]